MTLTMRAEIRDAWADALESGEYEQTKSVLAAIAPLDGGHEVVGMCCLGVLCDLAVKAGVIPEPQTFVSDEGDECFQYGDGSGGSVSYVGLPDAVVKWAGLDGDSAYRLSDPRLTRSDGITLTAATWNDEEDATFAEIAEMVRAVEPAPAPEPV